MKDSEKELKEELSRHFVAHGQRMTMLVKLIFGLLKLGTISYSKLSKVINPSVERLSNFKRIQRFMKSFTFCQQAYIQLVWSLFVGKRQWVALSMDRTNWKFGESNINILMLGISYKGTAIPLIWKLLDKRGNSNTEERIELLDGLLGHLSQEQQQQIKCLLADREFIGQEWISYLKKQCFNFIIRIRANTLVRKLGKHKEQLACSLFTEDHFKMLRGKRIIWGHQLCIAGQQITDKEWLILISNQSLAAGKQFYGERWGIEVFFAACKTRGFNFEDTHVVNLDRIFVLLFLIALAFIWAIKTGEWLLENGHKIPIKKLKKRRAKLYSLFRIGFDHLQERLLNIIAIWDEIKVLSCT
jgi:hypothetical protein